MAVPSGIPGTLARVRPLQLKHVGTSAALCEPHHHDRHKGTGRKRTEFDAWLHCRHQNRRPASPREIWGAATPDLTRSLQSKWFLARRELQRDKPFTCSWQVTWWGPGHYHWGAAGWQGLTSASRSVTNRGERERMTERVDGAALVREGLATAPTREPRQAGTYMYFEVVSGS